MQYVVVFDTNILISALLTSTGTPFRCLALAKTGQVGSVTCQDILDEFSEKLVSKFKFSEAMGQAAANEVRSFSRIVKISKTLRAVPNDPDDDMVVECALSSGATHIVTGDKHLLSLTNYQDVAIVKAADFLVLISSATI
ncbi:putative toxin-antitoxin system toxin component, PIN family [filamentous cyanobacterium CCT1]|nr:putative toxin-antitoxin system toxin component, PIN family [filamentous cyanobacterium CCT1]PSN81116.1 putative toxin-antitoxin system toxin component, PIN family [filamentous cyanobacterium CCP4]